MHNRLKKAVVFGLSACLMLGSLSGCSKKEAEFDPEATAVTVNGDEISARPRKICYALHAGADPRIFIKTIWVSVIR